MGSKQEYPTRRNGSYDTKASRTRVREQQANCFSNSRAPSQRTEDRKICERPSKTAHYRGWYEYGPEYDPGRYDILYHKSYLDALFNPRIDTPAGISYYTPSDTGPLTPQEAPTLQTGLRPRSDMDPQQSNGYVNGNPNDLPTPPQGASGFNLGASQDMPEYSGSRYHGGYGGPPQQNYIP